MLSLSFWALWRLIFWLDGSHEWWWLDGFWVLWLIFKALLKQVFFYHFWVLILCYHLVNLFDGLTDHILLVRIFSGIQFNIKHPNSEKFLVFDDFWEWLCITDKRKNHICFFLWWSAFLFIEVVKGFWTNTEDKKLIISQLWFLFNRSTGAKVVSDGCVDLQQVVELPPVGRCARSRPWGPLLTRLPDSPEMKKLSFIEKIIVKRLFFFFILKVCVPWKRAEKLVLLPKSFSQHWYPQPLLFLPNENKLRQTN